MDEQQLKAYKREAYRQATTVKKAYRYEDWTLVMTKNGNYLKVPVTTHIVPFPIVMEGKLPNSDKILLGVPNG